MKKYVFLMATVITTVFCACTDNKDEITLKLGQDGAKEATINRIGGTLQVPVTTNGDWTATLSEDCDWAFLVQSKGSGNSQVELDVDYLNPSIEDADRMTVLTVIAGDISQTIRIRQFVGIEDGVNEAYLDKTGFNDLYMTHGLGFGYNIVPSQKNTTLTKYPIVDKASLNKLAKMYSEYRNIVTETTDPKFIGTEGSKDSIHRDTQHLGIKAHLGVTYGLFKLDISGAYTMGQKNDKQNYRFYSSYKVPRVMTKLNVPDLAALADDEDLVNIVFTRGFISVRNEIINQINEDSNSDSFSSDKRLLVKGDHDTWQKYEDLAYVLSKLDKNYGPLYVASTTLGGDLGIEIRCDTTTVTDSIIVSGKVDTAIEFGLLQVEVNISADYAKIATDVLKNGSYSFTVRGGNSDTQQGISDALSLAKSKIDIDNIQKKIGEWVKSIPTDLTSQAAYENLSVYEQGLEPVWELFPSKYQTIIRGYFIYKYKGKNTLVDLEEL